MDTLTCFDCGLTSNPNRFQVFPHDGVAICLDEANCIIRTEIRKALRTA